jgi:ATP/maltotriose-dependent transcriptional regulator MalT
MTPDDRIERGRAAFARKAWSEAFDLLTEADLETPLGLDDLEMAGFAAQYSGHDEVANELASRIHRAALKTGDFARAARMAFWIGMSFLQRGEVTQGGGWLGRSAHLLDEHGLDTVTWGYLSIPDGIRQVESDAAGALAAFERAAAYAERFGDVDLGAMARLGRGRSLIALGETKMGLALLDDVMVAVMSDELSPLVTGIVYCGSIEAFTEIYDLRRAQDWTQALSDWTERQSDRLPFRGRCLVYRSALMRFHGDWSTALDEARRAEERLLRPPPEPAVGEAYYEQAELHRLRGDFSAAETAYREASQWGRRPEPGLALLLLARGRREAARTMIERALEEAADDIARVKLLPAVGEIALATGDRARAGEAVEGLTAAQEARPAPMLAATLACLDGEVRAANGNARAALGLFRSAESLWQELDGPYDLARVRTDLGQALLALGDVDSAALEFDAALRTFRELGAEPDIRRVERLADRPASLPGGLSTREAEVLGLVAGGHTNRAIASALGISERTVDRHVSNIFVKLGVTSRAAATAFAVEHDIA